MKAEQNFTEQEAIELTMDFVSIVENLEYCRARDDAGVADYEDTKIKAGAEKELAVFRKKYGSSFVKKHFGEFLNGHYHLRV